MQRVVPRFLAQRGSRRTIKLTRTTTESITNCISRSQALASKYFSCYRVSPTTVKLRIPEGETCSVRTIINDDFSSIRMLVGNLASRSADQPAALGLGYHLKSLGIKARRRDMNGLSQCARDIAETFPNIVVVKLYGLMAAWVCGHSQQEEQFITDIMQSEYFADDVPQIVHIFDELRCTGPISVQPFRSSLRLIFEDVTPFFDSERKKLKEFPEMPMIERRLVEYVKRKRPVPGYAMVPKRTNVKDRLERLARARDDAERFAPHMEIVTEGSTMTECEAEPIPNLMRQSKYAEVVSMASAALAQNPRNNDMLFHRAMALFKMEKYDDAIADCTRLINMLSTYGVRQFRAGLWEMVGQRQCAAEDIERQAT